MEIHTKLSRYPEDAESIIRKVLKPFAASFSIVYKQPLSGFKDPQSRVDASESRTDAQFTGQGMIPFFERILAQVSQKSALIGGVVVCFMLLLATFLGALFLQMRKQTKLLELGLKNLSSLAEGSGGRSPARSAASQSYQEQLVRNNPALLNGQQDSSIFEGFSDKAIAALITDCYWSESDQYGAYVWRHIPQNTRSMLLKQWSFLSEYARYLTDIEPVNLGLDQDPYYLAPLEIGRLDNLQVTKIIKEHPDIYHRIPVVRRDSLQLTATERLSFSSQPFVETLSDDSNLFAALKNSKLRQLPRHGTIKIASIDDERALLKIENILPEQMALVPSLIWTKYISDENLSAVLDRFSAEELASAWMAPEEVLSRLEKLIPERKLALIKNYTRRSAPDRLSSAFSELHRAIVADIEHATSEKTANFDALGQGFAA